MLPRREPRRGFPLPGRYEIYLAFPYALEYNQGNQ